MKQITVYTTGPMCQACNNTKRWLNKYGVPFTEIDANQNPKDADAIHHLGYTQAPVVIVSNGDPETDLHWSSFRPDLLAKYAGEIAA